MFRVQSNNLDAIAGEDYDAFNELITFQPSDTEKSLFITIRQDAKVENNEQFVLILTTDDDGVTIGDNVMTITITDDDGEYDQRLVVTSNCVNRLVRFQMVRKFYMRIIMRRVQN